MKHVLMLLLMLGVAFAAAAQQKPNDVAHGAEKASHEQAHPGEEHGGHTEQPKFLGMSFGIWKLINMLLFFGFMVYLLGGPIKRAFADRSQQIRREAEEARERRTKADQMAADIQNRLSRLEGELQAIRERAQADGERQRSELLAAAEAEAQKIVANAQSEVENRLRHARLELTEYAGQLAAERAELLLKEKITPADQQKLFRQSLQEVEEVRS